jgi:hypothetical protein
MPWVDGGVHQRQSAGQLFEQVGAVERLQLPGELFHHLLQHLRLEHAAAFAEAAQGKAFDSQAFAHLRQLRHLLLRCAGNR